MIPVKRDLYWKQYDLNNEVTGYESYATLAFSYTLKDFFRSKQKHRFILFKYRVLGRIAMPWKNELSLSENVLFYFQQLSPNCIVWHSPIFYASVFILFFLLLTRPAQTVEIYFLRQYCIWKIHLTCKLGNNLIK